MIFVAWIGVMRSASSRVIRRADASVPPRVPADLLSMRGDPARSALERPLQVPRLGRGTLLSPEIRPHRGAADLAVARGSYSDTSGKLRSPPRFGALRGAVADRACGSRARLLEWLKPAAARTRPRARSRTRSCCGPSPPGVAQDLGLVFGCDHELEWAPSSGSVLVGSRPRFRWEEPYMPAR